MPRVARATRRASCINLMEAIHMIATAVRRTTIVLGVHRHVEYGYQQPGALVALRARQAREGRALRSRRWRRSRRQRGQAAGSIRCVDLYDRRHSDGEPGQRCRGGLAQDLVGTTGNGARSLPAHGRIEIPRRTNSAVLDLSRGAYAQHPPDAGAAPQRQAQAATRRPDAERPAVDSVLIDPPN